MSASSKKSKTRRRILETLKTGGPTDAGALAETLGVTAMAVRQHLYDLQAEGLAHAEEEARPIGRPAKLWSLTETAGDVFPDAHADLALDLIATIRATLGEEAMNQIVSARSDQQADSYKSQLAKVKTFKGRVEGLADLRTREGYMAAVEDPGDGSLLLVENHCPICSAAKACSGLCAKELSVFQDVLGPGTEVVRTDHILAGARRCAYRIKPTTNS